MQFINLILIIFLAARNNFSRIDSTRCCVVSSWVYDVLAAARWHSLLSIAHELVSCLFVVCCVNRTLLLAREVLLGCRLVDGADESSAVVHLFVVVFGFVLGLLDDHWGIDLRSELVYLGHFWEGPLIALGLILVGHAQSFSSGVHTLVDCVVYNHA